MRGQSIKSLQQSARPYVERLKSQGQNMTVFVAFNSLPRNFVVEVPEVK